MWFFKAPSVRVLLSPPSPFILDGDQEDLPVPHNSPNST